MAELNLANRTIHELAVGLAAKEFSAAELVAAYADRVAAKDGEIKAFLKLDREQALKAAEAADARRAAGKPLSDYDGIPVGIKDCIVAEGESCSCASKILAPVKSPYDSTAVARLRAQGFIPFGRLNMDEFAMGSSCENSAFQKTANPCDVSRVPGGSSGGSAACVAAGRARFGHRRFDPPAGRFLRHRRAQADLRAGFALRTRGIRVQSRPDRPDDS